MEALTLRLSRRLARLATGFSLLIVYVSAGFPAMNAG
jgi:hypothetical protein